MAIVIDRSPVGQAAAIAAQVGAQQGRNYEFESGLAANRDRRAEESLGLDRQRLDLANREFDNRVAQQSLLQTILDKQTGALAKATGMDPNLAPQDMRSQSQIVRNDKLLADKKKQAKLALQHAWANGVLGQPETMESLGALQTLAPLVEADPDAVLGDISQRTYKLVAKHYEDGQRMKAADEARQLAATVPGERQAALLSMAMGIEGGWVKPDAVYSAMADFAKADDRYDLAALQQEGRQDLAAFNQNAMTQRMNDLQAQINARNDASIQGRQNVAEMRPVSLNDDRGYQALIEQLALAEEELAKFGNAPGFFGRQITSNQTTQNRANAQTRVDALKQQIIRYLQSGNRGGGQSQPMPVRPSGEGSFRSEQDADAALEAVARQLGKTIDQLTEADVLAAQGIK